MFKTGKFSETPRGAGCEPLAAAHLPPAGARKAPPGTERRRQRGGGKIKNGGLVLQVAPGQLMRTDCARLALSGVSPLSNPSTWTPGHTHSHTHTPLHTHTHAHNPHTCIRAHTCTGACSPMHMHFFSPSTTGQLGVCPTWVTKKSALPSL